MVFLFTDSSLFPSASELILQSLTKEALSVVDEINGSNSVVCYWLILVLPWHLSNQAVAIACGLSRIFLA